MIAADATEGGRKERQYSTGTQAGRITNPAPIFPLLNTVTFQKKEAGQENLAGQAVYMHRPDLSMIEQFIS